MVFSGAVPAWDLSATRLVLAVVRACWLAGLLSTSGALLFRALEPGLPPAIGARLLRLILGSLAVAGLAWLVWVALQAVVLVGAGHAPRVGELARTLRQTAFGQFAIAQLALLAAAALTLRLPRWVPAGFAFAATALQATHLHAWAMESGPGLLTGAVVLHLMAAAAWLGGLLPLRIVVRHSAPALAAAALRRFSARAIGLVLVLGATASFQGWTLLGGVPGIVGTAYGWMAMTKLTLFAVLLAFAAQNRWRLLPGLARPEPRAAQRALLRSLARETAAGLAIVMAAALLSALQPGMHAQPVWPFALQPSLVTVREDAGFAREALLAGAALLLAALLIGLAVASRLVRWPALAAAAVTLWFALPHLSLLLVPAYPTSFYHSPTGFAATAVAEGAALYPERCARCHGASGRGDGPDAAGLAEPPADLTAAHLWMHPDGELFWWLSHGMAAPDGTLAMPGFASVLSEDERWDLIDFIRARNAGDVRAATGGWSPAVIAPDLDADCADGRGVSLRDLLGKPVRVVFQDKSATPPAALPTAATVFVPRADASEAAGGDCIAADPSVLAAYAIVTGVPPGGLAGASVLIDANGWLRDVVPPGRPDQLADSLRGIAARPLPSAPGQMHHVM